MRDRRNLLLLHDFCTASEILETLLTSKIKLYQYWPQNAALGSQQLRINDSSTVFSAWYLLAVSFSKSAVQKTPTKWLLKPWQIHLRV